MFEGQKLTVRWHEKQANASLNVDLFIGLLAALYNEMKIANQHIAASDIIIEFMH
jgi:hypothetical protein